MKNKIISNGNTNLTSRDIMFEVLEIISNHLEIGEIPEWIFQYDWELREIAIEDMFKQSEVLRETYSKYLEWKKDSAQVKGSDKYIEYFLSVLHQEQNSIKIRLPIVLVLDNSTGKYDFKDGGRRILAAKARGEDRLQAYVAIINPCFINVQPSDYDSK